MTDPTQSGRAVTSIADPGPLGLAAFALTTFVLSVFNSGMIKTGDGVVLGLALAYGGIAQFGAGMWEFVKGNTFGAVAFCSFGMFWVSFYVLLHVTVGAIPARELFSALGLYLWAWGIFTAYMFVASLRTTGAVAAVFLLLAITFIVLGIGNSALAGTHNVTNNTIKLGGYLGLATAIVAWYTSFAAVTNSTFGRTVLPVFPLAR